MCIHDDGLGSRNIHNMLTRQKSETRIQSIYRSDNGKLVNINMNSMLGKYLRAP